MQENIRKRHNNQSNRKQISGWGEGALGGSTEEKEEEPVLASKGTGLDQPSLTHFPDLF